jgi:hypothetical protein
MGLEDPQASLGSGSAVPSVVLAALRPLAENASSAPGIRTQLTELEPTRAWWWPYSAFSKTVSI